MKILFICKKNHGYGQAETYCSKTHSGLFNSTSHIVEALKKKHVNAKIIEVRDNNSIDRAVHDFKPDKVVIEALWVVPEKFIVLKKLHPKVKWYVHVHSNIPFLAGEGIAIEWLVRQQQLGVTLIVNALEAYHSLKSIIFNLIYLPNIYNPAKTIKRKRNNKTYFDVGCFGAIRPLKNQLIQAMAAIKYAEDRSLKLRFHINSTRVEQLGEPILKNLFHLFEYKKDHKLVRHPWYSPPELLRVLSGMDMGMQVSLSETFNIVTADYVTAGLPVVVSDKINWISHYCFAKDDSVDSIVDTMDAVADSALIVRLNQFWLKQYSTKATNMWLEKMGICK